MAIARQKMKSNRTPSRASSSPLSLDPTRTVTLRLAAVRAVRRKFALLRGRVVKLVVGEDAFGLEETKRPIGNFARIEMPQIRKESWQQFLTYARGQTTLTEESGVDPRSLRAVQSEFSQERVDAIPAEKLQWPILVSRDGYVLDGNHRWIKAYQTDHPLKVLRLGLDRDDSLELMREFPQSEFVENSFCPTGPGGGIDPTCSPGGGKVVTLDSPLYRSTNYPEQELREASGGHQAIGAGVYLSEDPESVKGYGSHVQSFRPKGKFLEVAGDRGFDGVKAEAKSWAEKRLQDHMKDVAGGKPLDVELVARSAAMPEYVRGYLESKGISGIRYRQVDKVNDHHDQVLVFRTSSLVRNARLVVNPFVSEVQRRACYAKADPDWDCSEWEDHTPKGKLPKRKTTENWCNQYGGDTCSTGEARGSLTERGVQKVKDAYVKFSARYGRRGAVAIMAAMAVTMPLPGNIFAVLGIAEGVKFAASKLTGNESYGVDDSILDDVRLLAEELDLSFDPRTFSQEYLRQLRLIGNSFCPTGPGGGVDPTCSPSEQWKSSGIDPKESPLHADALRRINSSTVGGQIPIRKIFDRVLGYDDYSFPVATPGGKTTTKRVLISSLTATQTDMDAETVKFLVTHYNPERPMVYRVGKVLYVKDGHHTIAAEKMRGSSEVIVDIVNARYRPGMSPDDLTTNAGRWQFATDHAKVLEFQAWLRKQLDSDLLSRTDEELWAVFARQGYAKGAGRAFDDVNRSRRWRPSEGDFYAGSRESFLRTSFGQPESVDKLKILSSRSFTDLRNVTEDMATRMTRTLMDGLARGSNPRDLVDDLMEDMDVSQARAETVARTEIIRAHAEAQLDSMEKLGVEEVGVAVEWDTAKDGRVCPLCKPLQGVVLTIEEAHGLIPNHPNCRCAFVPANVGEDQPDQKRTKAEILAAFSEADVDPPDLDDERPKPLVEPTKNYRVAWEDELDKIDLSQFSQVIRVSPDLRKFSRYLKGVTL